MPKFDVDPALVRKLADLLSETGLTEIEYSEGDRRIRINKQPGPAPIALAGPLPAAAVPEAVAALPAPAPIDAIPSPMVGTVYLSPEPTAAPFVRIGDRIAEGATLLIIEAMKVMNPIRSPRAGTVTAILVEDGQPVEFGEALVALV